MEKKATPYQKIAHASKTTGLSQYCLRKWCREGIAPHIRSGTTYYINVPELIRIMGVACDSRSDNRKSCDVGTLRASSYAAPLGGDSI